MSAEPMKVTTMNVSLPPELARFVREKVESGHYSSASEVVREALRLLASAKNGHGEFDRAKVREAVDGLQKTREELSQRGVTMSTAEIRSAIEEGRA